MDFHSRDENNSQQTQLLIDYFRKLTKHGVTVFILHHNRKESYSSPNNAGQKLRGSTAIQAGVDSHLSIDKSRVVNGVREIIISQPKLRQGREISPFQIKLTEQGEFIILEYAGELEEKESKLFQAREKVLEILEDGEKISGDIVTALKQLFLSERTAIQQIKKKLEEVKIPAEFYAFAMKWFRREIMKDTTFQNQIKQSKEKQTAEVDAQISELLELLLKKTITDEFYKVKYSELSKKRADLGTLPANNSEELQSLLTKAEKCFDVARDGTEEIEKGEPERRKGIVIELGSNPSIKSRLFDICIKKALNVLRGLKDEINRTHRRLEPAKIYVNSPDLEREYTKNAILRCASVWNYDFRNKLDTSGWLQTEASRSGS